MRKILLLITACLLSVILKAQQAETVNTQTNSLLLSRLHEGTNKYLVYMVDSATNEIGSSDIWVRTLRFGERDNQPTFNFEWKWYHRDSLYRYVRSVCSKKNFAPVYQYSASKRSGIQAYDFKNGFMVPSDTVAGNRADPKKQVALNPPVFNWEWDMELFSTLPIKKVGQKFNIAFLDPSDNKPAYYIHEVIGRENLKLNEVSQTPCWLLKIIYEPGAYAVFWIAEKSGEVLKMKEYYKGKYRYKVKIY